MRFTKFAFGLFFTFMSSVSFGTGRYVGNGVDGCESPSFKYSCEVIFKEDGVTKSEKWIFENGKSRAIVDSHDLYMVSMCPVKQTGSDTWLLWVFINQAIGTELKSQKHASPSLQIPLDLQFFSLGSSVNVDGDPVRIIVSCQKTN